MEQHCFCLDESLEYSSFHLPNPCQEPGHQLEPNPQSERLWSVPSAESYCIMSLLERKGREKKDKEIEGEVRKKEGKEEDREKLRGIEGTVKFHNDR